MNKMHVVTGSGFSGSTLLCDILAMNKKFMVTGTSVLPNFIEGVRRMWAQSAETKAALADDPDKEYTRMLNAWRAFIKAYYPEKKIIFNKSRGWVNFDLLEELMPGAKALVCVRDPRAQFASVQRQDKKRPLLTVSDDPQSNFQYEKANRLYAPNQMLGAPIRAVENMLRENPKNVIVVQYEALAENPKQTMERIYEGLGEPYYDVDYDNLEPSSPDSGVYDALHLLKYSHQTKKKVEATDPHNYKKYVAPDVQQEIMNLFPLYNRAFGYQ